MSILTCEAIGGSSSVGEGMAPQTFLRSAHVLWRAAIVGQCDGDRWRVLFQAVCLSSFAKCLHKYVIIPVLLQLGSVENCQVLQEAGCLRSLLHRGEHSLGMFVEN